MELEEATAKVETLERELAKLEQSAKDAEEAKARCGSLEFVATVCSSRAWQRFYGLQAFPIQERSAYAPN